MTTKKVLCPVYDNGDLHVQISKGNIKVGNIPQFNTLPGDEPVTLKNGTPVSNIKGTCGKYCSECKLNCYAMKSVRQYRPTASAWGRNTVLVRTDRDKVRCEIDEFLKKNIYSVFRFHTSGEIESEEQLRLYCSICNDNPDVTFYVYTKAFDIIADYFTSNGHVVPGNLVINISVWHSNVEDFLASRTDRETVEQLFSTLNVFAYDDGTDEKVSKMAHCPAIDETGHETGITCAQCKRCFHKGMKTACHSH